jgi:hypothetical protein
MQKTDEQKTRQKITGEEKSQQRLFKKHRGGVVLSEDEVQAIKEGRKKLRKEMREKGIRSKKEFELTASGLGLYFDKSKLFPFLWWFHGRGLGLLLGAAIALLAALFLMSLVSQMRGHFTINISDKMFREGFVLSETADFKKATTHLFAEPAADVPCMSIRQIPKDIDQGDGQKNQDFFAYTFYLRNEGETPADYDWTLKINSESKDLSDATWVMVFEEDKMTLFAEPAADGKAQALPALNDDSRGYPELEIFQKAADPAQYEKITQKQDRSYYRVIPKNFLTQTTVTTGTKKDMQPGDVHKFTVVIWLEGDDPDCTDALIGGHLGLNFEARLVEETAAGEETQSIWDKLFS